MDELIQEMRDYRMEEYVDGAWQTRSVLQPSSMTMLFSAPFGRQRCAPMYLAEMRALPTLIPSLTSTGFYVAGFNPDADWLVLPLAWADFSCGRSARTPDRPTARCCGLRSPTGRERSWP